MIDISKLTEADVGRQIVYMDGVSDTQIGVLSSWNDEVVFVKFKGPNGEGCSPESVSFLTRSFDESYAAIRAAGGDAWDGLDVEQELAAMRGQPQGTEARVCNDIAERQALGICKYGKTVEQNSASFRAWLQHAYEEALDLAIYLKRSMEELDKHG